jgi:hypothetical protein
MKIDPDSLPENLCEKCNRKILVTGAGFSKDFGAPLANELWPYMYNGCDSDSIKSQMRRDENYENVYSKLNDSDKKIFMNKLVELFKLIDRSISTQADNSGGIEDFIELFIEPEKYNFIFTTNQDLFLERVYIKNCGNRDLKNGESNHGVKQIADDVKLYFPYNDYSLTKIIHDSYNGCVQSQEKYAFKDLIKTIKYDTNKMPSEEFINYIKLHGSFNWEHSEGYVINLTGDSKEEDIARSNITNSGFEIFKKICKEAQSLKFVIIGYSFRDKHLNEQLLNSIKFNNSFLYIVSPLPWSEFKKNTSFILNSNTNNAKQEFLEAIHGYYAFKFRDFLHKKSCPLISNQYDDFKKELLR